LIKKKGHWEALIIEHRSSNYAKVGAKTMDLEGNEVDVPGAISNGLGCRYFEAMKFLTNFKEIFNYPPEGKKV
jgi:hypothetical protein